MSNDPHNPLSDPVEQADAVEAGNADPGYTPHYSEPNFATTSDSPAWESPTEAAHVSDENSLHASAPDPSPLADGQADVGPAADQGAPAQPWWGGGQGPGGSAPGHQQTPYGQPAPGQQAPWSGAPQGQPYQPGPPVGGMPPQNYSGGYAPMPTGPNNPYWLAGPSEQGRNTVTLDYWLSVFFSWIPALIFFLTERDKNKLVDEHTKELLNFNITRVIASAVMVIPIIGWIVGGIASLALFIVAILGALKGPDEYSNGRTYQFPLAIRFIK